MSKEDLIEIHKWLIQEYGKGYYTKDIPNEFYKKYLI